MPKGGEQILLSPGRNIDRNIPRDSNYDNTCGEGNNQNLHGYYPAQDIINKDSGKTGSYQSLTINDQVLNSDGAGSDLNNQGDQGGGA